MTTTAPPSSSQGAPTPAPEGPASSSEAAPAAGVESKGEIQLTPGRGAEQVGACPGPSQARLTQRVG